MQTDGINTNIIHYYAYKGTEEISLTSQIGDFERVVSTYSNAQPSNWAELHVCFIVILPPQ